MPTWFPHAADEIEIDRTTPMPRPPIEDPPMPHPPEPTPDAPQGPDSPEPMPIDDPRF